MGLVKVMSLDWRICSRARLARDPRFDGKFFIAVLSTGIYCRPICRARTSKESNVRYFPTAAAAAEAGFRPCLRCHPECSPGTPVWAGTQNTVSRALRLICQSGLEDGVEGLAEHLGVGSRHLRRLFVRHLGATPSAVAQTRRLHFAKKLIDETTLPMTQVALASGFGCVRRFNATISSVYHRTPTRIRSLARRNHAQMENQYIFHLNFRPPYDWNRMLTFLAARATPGVEMVEAGSYRRSITVNGGQGYFDVSHDPENNALIVRVEIGDPRALFFIIERIRAMFDLNADWPTIARTLRTDPALVSQITTDPGLRLPGSWNGFELTTRAIIDRRIDMRSAAVLAGRMVSAFGQPFSANGLSHLFPTPEVLADADLRAVGFPKTSARAIRALAHAVCDGQISFERVADSAALLARFSDLLGIGESTAQYLSMRAFGEPDAFPYADLHLTTPLGFGNSRELQQRAEAWRPWRAYAAMYLYNVAGKCRVSGGKSAVSPAAIEIPSHHSLPIAV
jgi:AraC family transcriptional regulator, regulatory protein of adaptative response / DNA-3-methyladenine glycosylase II